MSNIFKSFRDFERAFKTLSGKKIKRMGHFKIRQSHLNIVLNIGDEKKRISDISISCDMSQQAIGKHIRELKRAEYLNTEIDASDKRATLVFLNNKGLKLLNDINTVNREMLDIIDENYFETGTKLIKNNVEMLF